MRNEKILGGIVKVLSLSNPIEMQLRKIEVTEVKENLI